MAIQVEPRPGMGLPKPEADYFYGWRKESIIGWRPAGHPSNSPAQQEAYTPISIT